MTFQSLLEKKFRAGDFYRLAEWSQLGGHQKESLARLQDESDVYGIFEPLTTSKKPKVAYREVALLYLHLQRSNKLPRYLIFSGDESTNETIAALLLDGIIEVEWEGKFVSGPGALAAIYDDDVIDEDCLQTYLSKLSYKAIHYVWMLNDADQRSMASRLYAFNTIPWDASTKTIFYDNHNVKDFLFSCIEDDAISTLKERWHFTITEKKEWLSWSREVTENFGDVHSPRIYKLYISPVIGDLSEVFSKCIPLIDNSDAISFKIGNSLPGLLRPDKMVIYFFSKESLIQTAGALRNSLSGCASQGVPFTSQLDDNGLLSWGEDPRDEGRHSFDSGSWRTMISNELAAILEQAKKNQLNWPGTIAYVEAMMKTKGVNMLNWEPTDQFNN